MEERVYYVRTIARGKTGFLALILCVFILCYSSCAFSEPGLDSPTPVAPYLDGVFPDNSPGSSSGDWTQVDYYPSLSFVEPIRIVEHPTQNKLIIVGKDGKGWSVTHQQGSTDKTLFFDIGPIMHGKSGNGEGGISDLVFHPEFGNSGSSNSAYVYISYRWEPNKGGTFSSNPTVDGYNRISRFSVTNNQVDLSTELVLINQFDRQQWHIGGAMFFGDDGFLYISAGDEGNCCDRLVATQRLDGGLWSGLLRIDVDQDSSRSHAIRRQPIHPEVNPQSNGMEWPLSFTQGYYIPDDNPFVDVSGSNLEEFYSIGMRHPWEISYDAVTGNIWAADVGEAAREEINIIDKGDNHQWAYKEGTIAGVIPQPAQIIGNEAPPIWEYDRSIGQAVIGAGVYRGNKFPELFGEYLFSDFISGKLWTATANSGGYTITEIGSVSSGFPNGINSYLLDSKGDILLAKTSGGLDPNGKIQMLARSGSVPPAPEPPQLLSQTGAFTDLATLSVHPGCVPYDLNVPFWSDNTIKSRWMCVPNDGQHDSVGEQINFSQNGDWIFPVGAVLIKHFELQTDTSNPNAIRRLETRFIVHAEDGYYGVTYRWDDFGIDAQLLTTSEDLNLTVQTPSGPIQQTWHFPSRNECLTCHSTVAGGALGPKTRQLNRTIFYPLTGRTSNQIETLNSLGMLSPGISNIQNFINTVLTSTPTDDVNASLSARARSYLDSNCSYCHRPNGVRANFDARLTTPLDQQGLVNGSLAESFGVAGEAVIVPGSLSQSILFQRANSAGETFSMPPLAKALVDTPGMSVIQNWIQALANFELGNDTTTGGSFIDNHHPSLYINEQDIFIQDNEAGTLNVKNFKFYAQRLGNPLTPIVVRVNGDNDFTVLAIGTTRAQNEYFIGENIFPFDDNGEVILALSAADKIAIGFMDSFPDGSGWGAGTVIPAEAGSGAAQDEIWALLPDPLINQTTGFLGNRDTPIAVVGESILFSNAGKALLEYTGLRRSYKFDISFSLFSSGSGGGNNPPTVTNPGTQTNTEGDTNISLFIQASDLDFDSLTYSAVGLPTGLSIDSNIGEIFGDTTVANTFNPIVTVSDGNGGNADASFVWTVNPTGGGGPTVSYEFESLAVAASDGTTNSVIKSNSGASGGQYFQYNSNAVGEFVTFPIDVSAPGAYDLDLQYHLARYRGTFMVEVAETLGGTYTQIGVMNTTVNSGSSFPTLSMIATFASAGTKYVRFTATGSNPNTGSERMALDSIDVTSQSGGGNQPPVLTNIDNQTVTEQQLLTIDIMAMDPDGDDLILDATPLLDSNGDAVTGISFVDFGNGIGQFMWTPGTGATALSPYTVMFSATEDTMAGLSDSQSVSIFVNDGSGGGPTVSYEFESLTVAASDGTTTSAIKTKSGASGGQYFQYNSNAVGEFVTFPIDVSAPGAYDLDLQYHLARYRGTFMVEVAETLGGTYTQIGVMNTTVNSGSSFPTLSMTATFASAGTKYVRFTATGSNPNTGSERMALDQIEVTPQ